MACKPAFLLHLWGVYRSDLGQWLCPSLPHFSHNSSVFHRIILQDRWRSFSIRERKQRARSIQPKFRPGKVVHLKRWTSFFEIFRVGPNRSIEFWTEISGNFGWMDRAEHVQKSRTSNFVRRTFYRYAMEPLVCTVIPELIMVGKYIVVYHQIKAADQSTAKTKNGGENRLRSSQKQRINNWETSFRTRGFGDNYDDFWPL